MRGTLYENRLRHIYTRITPAHAGNTLFDLCLEEFPWDHPRACGEHRLTNGRNKNQTGSPPRMRGTHAVQLDQGYGHGITPAHAGNTHISWSHHLLSRDHPRACGEHSESYWIRYHATGSPPRMRGTPTFLYFICKSWRITPAHAGNTS
mgnify:CR=1 FL=1